MAALPGTMYYSNRSVVAGSRHKKPRLANTRAGLPERGSNRCANIVFRLRMPLIARRYLIRGRVQGVGFRYFAQRVAADIGVNGYTRNLDDGRVEVYAIGSSEQLSELSGRLWKGPRLADVRGVEEQEANVQQYDAFHIEP